MNPDATDGNDGFDHPALLYASREQYLAAVLAFIEAAREADRPAQVAVPPDNLELWDFAARHAGWQGRLALIDRLSHRLAPLGEPGTRDAHRG